MRDERAMSTYTESGPISSTQVAKQLARGSLVCKCGYTKNRREDAACPMCTAIAEDDRRASPHEDYALMEGTCRKCGDPSPRAPRDICGGCV